MKKIFKKATVWVTALTLVLGTAIVPASAAAKPTIEDVDYNGKGTVEVEFAKDVKYKKAKVTVKDNKGKSYKASITKKDSDDLKFKINKAKKNRTYTFKIKGVKNKGTKKFVTVAGKVKAPKKAVAAKTLIGKEEAKSIAFQDAGVAEADAKAVRVEFDYDDGIAVYEVEFRTADAKYEYDIAGKSGRILERDKDVFRKPAPRKPAQPVVDNNANTEPTPPEATAYIGTEKAKEIALADAGLTAAQVRYNKAKLDREDGRMVYEVEFARGQMEYEYEIDAVSGDIVKKDVEYDD